VTTEDGGGHWTPPTSSTPYDLWGIAVAADGRDGWAVGDYGKILATEDGGEHWAQQISSTSSNLWGVAFAADGSHGWAVGANGTVLATENGGEHWTLQASSTSRNLWGIAVAADGRQGWAVGGNGTILIPVGTTVLDEKSVELAQSASSGEIEVSLTLRSNPWLPVWAVHLEARTEKRDWSPVGLATAQAATSEAARWQLSWKPADEDFRPGDAIYQRVMIYAGGTAPVSKILGSLVFDPWWERLWREHQATIMTVGAPFGLFALYAGGFLLVLMLAPGRLAGVGSATLDAVPAQQAGRSRQVRA